MTAEPSTRYQPAAAILLSRLYRDSKVAKAQQLIEGRILLVPFHQSDELEKLHLVAQDGRCCANGCRLCHALAIFRNSHGLGIERFEPCQMIVRHLLFLWALIDGGEIALDSANTPRHPSRVFSHDAGNLSLAPSLIHQVPKAAQIHLGLIASRREAVRSAARIEASQRGAIIGIACMSDLPSRSGHLLIEFPREIGILAKENKQFTFLIEVTPFDC